MRARKEALLNQHARVFWMCGLSGAGKSTLANHLEEDLTERGFLSLVIDGDDIRSGLNKGLGYSQEDRKENLRRVAELARLTAGNGIISIVAFITPTQLLRNMVKNIVGEPDYIEIYINATLEICEQRDTKGLYKQARKGMIRDFTGIDSPFEVPSSPHIEIDTANMGIGQCSQKLLDFVLPMIDHH